MTRRLPVALAALSLHCGSPQRPPADPPPPAPAPVTRATLAGPTCEGGQRCACRDDDAPADEPRPPAPYKRFEIRVGPVPNAVWVTVDDRVLYKSAERPLECFTVDLLPGVHPVRVQAEDDAGVAIAIRIREQSGGGPWWYDTFAFDCGRGGLCDLDGLRAEQRRIAAVPRGIHAPCGSVKVQRFQWRTGRLPDALHPDRIAVDFALNVYRFATERPPGDAACARGRR
ncbi:MAG: hypothetical protein D6689_05800 [Deltaproteobacteria bacterium]|nr:MAG: hypothetical protein D6689_05800 [Deltaproteobacteria bacterium]